MTYTIDWSLLKFDTRYTVYYMVDGSYLERDWPNGVNGVGIFRVNGVQVFPAVWQWYYEGKP